MRDRLREAFIDLGEKKLKNIAARVLDSPPIEALGLEL